MTFWHNLGFRVYIIFFFPFGTFQEGPVSFVKSDGLKRGFQSIDSSDYQMDEAVSGKPLI